MSITITTDVFCDVCGKWIHGVTGSRPDRRTARHRAKANGWIRRLCNGKMIDECSLCRAKQEK